MQPHTRSRRPTAARISLLATLMIGLAACSSTQPVPPQATAAPPVDPAYRQMYAATEDNGWNVPAVDVDKVDPKYLRQIVDYRTEYPVGTIVVDPHARFLYLVMEDGKAMRYGVGVAKAGLEFEGEATIERKAEWPRWTPTQNMIRREPERYGPVAGGVEGGIENPLGARALYLFEGGKDTLYRLHGTTEPWSIGKSVSSGCIRLFNQDIIDLHSRVPRGARVVVLDESESGKGEYL